MGMKFVPAGGMLRPPKAENVSDVPAIGTAVKSGVRHKTANPGYQSTPRFGLIEAFAGAANL